MCSSAFWIGGQEEIIGPRKYGAEIHPGIRMVLQVARAVEPQQGPGTPKPVRFDTVNRPMNAGPEVGVQEDPDQQRRAGDDDRGKRARGEPPRGEQDEQRAGDQQHVLQGGVDEGAVVGAAMVRAVIPEVLELRVENPVAAVLNPAVRAVLEQRDQRYPNDEPDDERDELQATAL